MKASSHLPDIQTHLLPVSQCAADQVKTPQTG